MCRWRLSSEDAWMVTWAFAERRFGVGRGSVEVTLEMAGTGPVTWWIPHCGRLEELSKGQQATTSFSVRHLDQNFSTSAICGTFTSMDPGQAGLRVTDRLLVLRDGEHVSLQIAVTGLELGREECLKASQAEYNVLSIQWCQGTKQGIRHGCRQGVSHRAEGW